MSKDPINMKVLVGSLDEQVLQAQVSIFLQGKLVISKWLQTANDEGVFEEAIEIRDEHLEDPYEAARIWFGVR